MRAQRDGTRSADRSSWTLDYVVLIVFKSVHTRMGFVRCTR